MILVKKRQDKRKNESKEEVYSYTPMINKKRNMAKKYYTPTSNTTDERDSSNIPSKRT